MAQVRKKKITIRDVAQYAGVSYQTVSRVLNTNGSVAEETRKKVQEAMAVLDFIPNKIAQMLTTNRSQTLELVIVDVPHAGRFAESMNTMAVAAYEVGYSLLVTMCAKNNLEHILENAASRLIDGIIMYAPFLQMADEELLELCNGIPLVRRDYLPHSRLAWVGFDQVYATRRAVEYFIEFGHRQIALIPPSLTMINGQIRHETWKETLQKHHLEPGPICESSYTFGSGYAAMNRILESKQPFTAVLVGSDTMVLGVLRALREHHLRIPEDVSVISFDDGEWAAYTDPPLTTIELDFQQQDTMAVKLLVDILKNPDRKVYQQVLLPELIIRESTRKIVSTSKKKEVADQS